MVSTDGRSTAVSLPSAGPGRERPWAERWARGGRRGEGLIAVGLWEQKSMSRVEKEPGHCLRHQQALGLPAAQVRCVDRRLGTAGPS